MTEQPAPPLKPLVPKPGTTSIIDRLNKEINTALADPKMKVRLADLGATVMPGSPADFGKHIAAETEKWAKVIRAANIKPSDLPIRQFHNPPFGESDDTLLHRNVLFRPAAEMGHAQTPKYVRSDDSLLRVRPLMGG
jgi:hypothetical protein